MLFTAITGSNLPASQAIIAGEHCKGILEVFESLVGLNIQR